MFEISVACKYLLPRWRQLSVSIISLISVLVIALVVWLILVFFSVTNGLEKMWTDKLIGLTAPVRVTPTDAYYKSYYYLADSISASSNYSSKSIAEKLNASLADPYDPDVDEEIPTTWPQPVTNHEGEVIDLVKIAFNEVNNIKGVQNLAARDFEMTFGNIYLDLIRSQNPHEPNEEDKGSAVSQSAYLVSFDGSNPSLTKNIQKLSSKDITNLVYALHRTAEGNHKDFQNSLRELFDSVNITALKTPEQGWILPYSLLPKEANWEGLVWWKDEKPVRLLIPTDKSSLSKFAKMVGGNNDNVTLGKIKINEHQPILLTANEEIQLKNTPIALEGGLNLPASLIQESLKITQQPGHIKFKISTDIQGTHIEGVVSFKNLEAAKFEFLKSSETAPKLWVHTENDEFVMPCETCLGEGVVLPKSYRDAGILLGDQGYLSYYAPTASSMQEQRIPIFVAGFYDHGVLPVGGKMFLVNKDITTNIRSSYDQNDTATAGINVRFKELDKADDVKEQLETAFKEQGIEKYWRVETYRNYEFTKALLQELASQRNLFTLISMVIIVVACSNIISMLIILVNDKKVEIGILKTMGATSWSIAFIFGFCGIMMGLVGSLMGIILAVFTLEHLQTLINLIGRMQGHQMFNATFYGDTLPNELSYEALTFVIVATGCISLLAGIVPAVKACLLKPSSILRSE